MAGWRKHEGRAVVLPLENVDTDQLIPARFMSVPRAEGYGRYLLHDIRRDDAGGLRPDFALNRHPEASIIVTRQNFGSGSSREAAVYALVDAGIRAVIAPGFGDIFASNAINNGLLTATLGPADCTALEQALGTEAAEMQIDLERSQILLGALSMTFSLDESWRTKLINGWDDIDLTRQYAADIAAFRQTLLQTAPWAWPASVG